MRGTRISFSAQKYYFEKCLPKNVNFKNRRGQEGVLLRAIFFAIFQLTFLHPPVRATVGEVRYSIEIDVGGE